MTLNWRSVTPSTDRKFMVKGTELSVAIVPGTLSRFQLCEIRSYDAAGEADRVYQVRDAATVNDDEIKRGIRPRVVATVATIDEAVKYCNERK